jgi:hypothetical protein
MRGAALLVLLASCGGNEAPPEAQCLTDLIADCTPQYEPTFANVFNNTLLRSCGVGGGSCHSAEGGRGGLQLDDEQVAYDHLLNARVVAGDPACSSLVERLERSGRGAMPPGGQLLPEERCAVQRWVADGAQR